MFTPISVDQDDICIILFSSGTTGLPKPVPRTHRNVLTNRNCNRDSFHFAHADDIIPIPWSLCHSSQVKLLTMGLFVGSKTIIFPDLGINIFYSYIHKYKVLRLLLLRGKDPSDSQVLVFFLFSSNYFISHYTGQQNSARSIVHYPNGKI